jgi:hypothetical protein
MKMKPYLLPLIFILLATSVYFLPEPGDMAPSAVKMEIPSQIEGWTTKNIPPSKEEIDILAEDTTFSKAICFREREGEFIEATGATAYDRIDLSIVLSGYDLNNSIHRPERCMPSQGHLIGTSSIVDLDLANGRKMAVQRLLSIQSIPFRDDPTKFTRMNCVTYYFFVGNEKITPSHTERTLIDVKDRLLRGMDQRWAYVSVSMWYGDLKLPWIEKEIPIQEADSKLLDFIKNFAEQRIDWEMISS